MTFLVFHHGLCAVQLFVMVKFHSKFIVI